MFSFLAGLVKPLASIVVPLASKAGKFLKKAFSDSQDTSSLTYRVKGDERYQDALREYARAKDIRERELGVAQLERANELKEQELKDRRELSALQRELMRELQAKEIEVKLTEIQTLWDKDTWFSKLSRQETEQILLQQQHRLLILLSPPEISEDCPASFRNNLKTEMRSVGAFLNEHYSPQDSLSPVKFYSDYFNQPISDIDVERLQRILSPVPTIILYSDISDYAVTFRIGFWGIGNSEATIFSTKPWNWEEAQKLILEAGKSETQSFRIIRQIVVSIHKLLASFWADSYYLKIDPNYEPKLFDLSKELIEEGLNEELIQPYLYTIQELKQQRLESYQQELERLAEIGSQKNDKNELKVVNQELSALQEEEMGIINRHKVREASIKKQSESFTLIHSLNDANQKTIHGLTFSPHGNILVSSNGGGYIYLWDSNKGEKISLLRQRDLNITSIAVSPDGRFIVSGGIGNNNVELIELETGQIVTTFKANYNQLHSLAFSPDGELLASGYYNDPIKVWKVSTGKTVEGSFPIMKDSFYYYKDYSVAFSPDGQILAAGSSDGTIRLLKVSGGKQIYYLVGHTKLVSSIAFSPDGNLLATGSYDDNTIKLWAVSKGEIFCTLKGHDNSVTSVSFSPDGRILASGGLNKTIKLWRVDTGEELRTLTCEQDVFSIAFSSDGLMFAAGCSGGLIYVWRCESGGE